MDKKNVEAHIYGVSVKIYLLSLKLSFFPVNSTADYFNTNIFCSLCFCWYHGPYWQWSEWLCTEPLHKVWDSNSHGIYELVRRFAVIYFEFLDTGLQIEKQQQGRFRHKLWGLMALTVCKSFMGLIDPLLSCHSSVQGMSLKTLVLMFIMFQTMRW